MKFLRLRIFKYIVAIFIFAALLDIFLQDQLLRRYRNDQVLSVSLQTAALRARIEKELNGSLLLIQGLADFISLHPALDQSDFEQYCKGMIRRSELIRTIGAAPDFIIRYVFPKKFSSSLMGLDYRDVSEQWEQVEFAHKSGEMVVAGPIDLIQGGSGFIGRVPIFIRENEYFWGVVSAVIDTEQLLNKAGIDEKNALRIAIRGVDGKGADGAVFYGDPDLFNQRNNPVLMPVTLPSGSWQIAAIPRSGWGKIPPDSMLLHGLVILFVLGISFSVLKIVSKNHEVERVKSRLSEAQLFAHLGNWDRDIISGDSWWSNETYRILGVEREIFKPSMKSLLKLVHPDDRGEVINLYTDAMVDRTPVSFDHRIIRPDGELRYVSEQVKFEYDDSGKPIRSFGTILDITDRKKIENELLESKLRFDHISKKLSNRFIFFSHTINGVFTNLSEGFEILGYGPPEAGIGVHWTKIVSFYDNDFEFVMEQNSKVLSGERDTIEYEVPYLHPSGQKRYLAIFAYTTFNHELGERVFEGVAMDVTERREREEKLKILTRAIENAPISVVITDTEGDITYVNPYFTKETGYTREEAIGENPRVLKSGKHDEVFYKDMWNAITSGETWRGEFVNKKKDGSLFWEAASISPIYNRKGEIVSYVAVKEDISHKKELERLKNDVDLIMRHDLKTPLNGIIGLPGLLLMDDNLTEQQIEFIKIIEDSGKNMLHMIDMSLDMFKMETGKYQYHPRQVDVTNIARRVISHSSSKLSAQRVTIEVLLDGSLMTGTDSLIVWGEDRLIYSLLSGLVTNAIEASPANAIVSLELFDSNQVSIKVRNKGVVPAKIRDVFFEKYVTKGKETGTGLGTYSAKLMADAMHYDISMETSDSAGETCITISIPFEKQESSF